MSNYDKREQEIIEKLKQGRSREDISVDYDYSNWKSLDIFMRRRNYTWNGEENIYEVETNSNIDNIRDELLSNISIKAEQVINRIDEGQDPRQIAQSLGYDDHRHLADEMKKEGLIWDSEIGNYVEKEDIISNSIALKSDLKLNTGNSKPSIELKSENNDINIAGIEKYVPILELLYENKDKLTGILLDDNEGSIPRYSVPGAAKPKSILYMSDKLARLLADFSSRSNISQREVVETSIILYLKQYGGSYKKDIESLLSKK